MKTHFKICLMIALLLAVVLLGCGMAAKPAPTPDVPADVPDGAPSAPVAPATEASSPEITIPRSLAPDLPDTKTVTVTTADEFIAALDSNVTIRIETELLDLSTASGYGEAFGDHYRWAREFDGPTLEIHDVENLRIIGSGKDSTVIQATPRYADVLRFVDCKNLALFDFTAGHLKEAPGSCSGMVLTFRKCSEVSIRACGLFGCGVMGIWAFNCIGFQVRETEIYECSSLAATIDNCRDVSFEGCSIYDCDDGNNKMDLFNCSVTWNGETLRSGSHWFDHGACTGGAAWDW